MTAISVADALLTPTGQQVVVRGYIVGQPISTDTVLTTATGDTALAIADDRGEVLPAAMLFLSLPAGALRTAWGLLAQPSNLRTLVDVLGTRGTYFSRPGLTTVNSIGGVLPSIADLRAYLGPNSSSRSNSEIATALAVEVEAQDAACRVPALEPRPVDLVEALMRRVARNLAMRNLPLGVMADQVGSVRLGPFDPEVRRLEAPWLRTVIG